MRLFVHIPKNGGQTIRRGLPGRIIVASSGNHISPQYTTELHNMMEMHKEHHGNEHARWRDWRKDLRDKYRAFAIVRNPWSRVVSRYTFARRIKGYQSGKQSFSEFLEERHIYGERPYYWHRPIRGWYQQKDYVTDESGGLRCDVLRFATDDVCQYFKLSEPLRVRGVSNIDGKDYRDFYGDEEYDIVADWYQKDIEYFGFTFDGPATKNIWMPT